MNTDQLTKYIVKQLRAKGVRVDIQPSITTSSVYLSFDHGVLKKARVGDHRGKGYHYTYEIGQHVKPPYEVEDEYMGIKYTRYRFTDEQADDLVMQVLLMRSNLRAKYGKERYAAFVKERARAA